MILKFASKWFAGLIACGLCWQAARAHERLFTYTYEPETMPQGTVEFEQWVTWRLGRAKAVGEDDFNRWDFRSELEYGVADNYTLGLYLNTKHLRFRDSEGRRRGGYQFTGVSLENRYMVLNPAEHPVGLTLYLEPTYDGKDFELEQKIILGQRHGDWKWAVNLTHATEWEEHFENTEGELELSFGIARSFGPHWSLGVELRDHNELPQYNDWENTAIYLGPVVSYHRQRWWAALTVMPQIWGHNFGKDPDGNRWLDLEGHERLNLRLMFGISF